MLPLGLPIGLTFVPPPPPTRLTAFYFWLSLRLPGAQAYTPLDEGRNPRFRCGPSFRMDRGAYGGGYGRFFSSLRAMGAHHLVSFFLLRAPFSVPCPSRVFQTNQTSPSSSPHSFSAPHRGRTVPRDSGGPTQTTFPSDSFPTP